MRRSLIVVLVLVILAGAGAWGWLNSAHGFSARAQPTWIEAKLAALSRSLALPGNQNSLKNPYPATPATLAQSRQLYQSQCALCHNDNGDGRSSLGQSLYPKPPDLRGLTQGKSDGALFYSIRNGIRMSGMPAWSQDSDEQIWNMVTLIRRLPATRGRAEQSARPLPGSGAAAQGPAPTLAPSDQREQPRQNVASHLKTQ